MADFPPQHANLPLRFPLKIGFIALFSATGALVLGLGIWAYAAGDVLLGSTASASAWGDKMGALQTSNAQDPFAGDTWHAVEQTWPGTMVFTAKSKSVLLKPLGAPEIQGTYSYEIKHASSNNLSAAKLVEGTLRMTNTIGQVSTSLFRLKDGGRLTLTYMTGQRPESYIRLSETEAQDQKAQLEQLLRSGELQQFSLSPSLQQ